MRSGFRDLWEMRARFRTSKAATKGPSQTAPEPHCAVDERDAFGREAVTRLGLITSPAIPASDIARYRRSAGVPEADYMVVTTGRRGLIVEIIAHNRRAMRETTEQRIGAPPGIRSIKIFAGLPGRTGKRLSR